MSPCSCWALSAVLWEGETKISQPPKSEQEPRWQVPTASVGQLGGRVCGSNKREGAGMRVSMSRKGQGSERLGNREAARAEESSAQGTRVLRQLQSEREAPLSCRSKGRPQMHSRTKCKLGRAGLKGCLR